MKKLKLVVSLPNENSYQLEQARTAKEKASQLGADIRIIFAENDAVTQSQQVLEIVQSRTERPDAILFEPLTATALARVGEAAVDAGIGWIVLNCDVEYLETLRQRAKAAPAFAVTRDHTEIGRVQGKQPCFRAVAPSSTSKGRQRALLRYSAAWEWIAPSRLPLKQSRFAVHGPSRAHTML